MLISGIQTDSLKVAFAVIHAAVMPAITFPLWERHRPLAWPVLGYNAW